MPESTLLCLGICNKIVSATKYYYSFYFSLVEFKVKAPFDN